MKNKNNKIKIKVSDIIMTNEYIIIKSSTNDEYIGNIIRGSFDFEIYNEDNKEINISYINKNDYIIIEFIKKENILKILKIFVFYKYNFLSESSESSEFEDYIN